MYQKLRDNYFQRLRCGISLCIAHYEMSDTFPIFFRSIYSSLSPNDEIVILDDGSSDQTLNILSSILSRYATNNGPSIVFKHKSRSRIRKLGSTRNLSIILSSKPSVALHIDCDDIFQSSHIITFFKAFCLLSAFYGDIYLSGHQLQVSSRSLLLSSPYPNIYFGEDKFLWASLTHLGKIFYLSHKPLRERSSIPWHKKFSKSIKTSVDALYNESRLSRLQVFYLVYERIVKPKTPSRLLLSIFQLLCLPVVYIHSLSFSPLPSRFINLLKSNYLIRSKRTTLYHLLLNSNLLPSSQVSQLINELFTEEEQIFLTLI